MASANFTASASTKQLFSQRAEHVRIGPISILTLIIVLCMAVLSVLTVSTANASLTMAQRRATATTELYLDETAAQAFLAEMDAQLAVVREAGGSGTSGAVMVETMLVPIRDSARAASGGQVEIVASVTGNVVQAEFACANGRVLNIQVTIRDDATYRIDKWKMTAVQNEEPVPGRLWSGA